MANDLLYSAVVNQKLAFARIQLKAASDQPGEDISAKLARHAHLDSAIMQLVSALTYFVAEVAGQYGLQLDPAPQNLPALLAEFKRSGRQSAAVAELLALQQQDQSWLAELLAVSSTPLLLAQRFKSSAREARTSEGMIPVVEVTAVDDGAGSESSPLGTVGEWAAAAQAYVDRQRASMHEE